MDYYKNEIRETLADLVADGYETREEILNRWERGETEDDFGNFTGSRFCSTYKAEEALKKAGFPFDDELNELLKEFGYNDFQKLMDRGAEVVDVILCELTLLGTNIINELREEGGEE